MNIPKKERTPKQKAASQYGQCKRSIAVIKSILNKTKASIPLSKGEYTITERPLQNTLQFALTWKQISKLERDLADLFKLTGLRIKS